MPVGRPKNPGTDADRAEARRAKVRANVRAFRKRQKERKLAVVAGGTTSYKQGLLYPPDDLSETTGSLTTGPSPSWPEQESDYADPDSWIWQLSRDLDNDPAYQDAFLAALQHQCLPYRRAQTRVIYEPCKRFSICCPTWIQAGTLEIGTPALQIMNDAVLSSALTIVGRSRTDTELVTRGAFIQSRALRGLSIALQQLTSKENSVCCTTLPMQALTCAISELLSNHDWGSFASHLSGVGALIEHAGPESLKSRETREHFYGYRSLQAAFSLMHGHAPFLANPEWIAPSWKHEVETSGHPFHTMLDFALKLVPEINRGASPRIWMTSELTERLQRLSKIRSQLDEWEQDIATKHRGRLYSKRGASWTGLYDYAFEFASLSIGIAFAMYTGVRIKLAWMTKVVMLEIMALDPGASLDAGEPIWDGLKWARQALQSLEYFHTGRPKACGEIVTLFPLETAWSFISDVHAEGRIDMLEERQWCLATARRLSSLGIAVFRWR